MKWQKGKLEDYIKGFIVPQRDKPKSFGGSIPWCRIEDIDGVYLRQSKSGKCVTQEMISKMPLRVFPPGTVIVSCSADLGRCAIVSEPLVTNQTFIGLVAQPALSPLFLYHLMTSRAHELNAAATGATIKYLSQAKFRALDVSVPPLPEQKRIVGILEEAFEGIATAKANAEKNLQNARAIFESHLQAVFVQRGKGWVEQLVSSFCDVKHGFAFAGAEFSNDVPEGHPLVITPGNFTEDGKLLFNEKNTKRFSGEPPANFRFDVGDLVVVMTDQSSKMKILGKPAFVEMDDVLHNQRIGRLVFSDNRVEKRFLYYFMMSESFLKNIKASATGTMVKHTAPKRIMSNVIRFPRDRKEQRAIVRKLDSLREETRHLASLYERKLAELEALKKSLPHQAFSGEL